MVPGEGKISKLILSSISYVQPCHSMLLNIMSLEPTYYANIYWLKVLSSLKKVFYYNIIIRDWSNGSILRGKKFAWVWLSHAELLSPPLGVSEKKGQAHPLIINLVIFTAAHFFFHFDCVLLSQCTKQQIYNFVTVHLCLSQQ